GVVHRRQHQDRVAEPPRASPAADLEPVAVGEAPVEDEQVVIVKRQKLVRLADPGRLVAGEAGPRERPRHQRAKTRVVLEDQGPHRPNRKRGSGCRIPGSETGEYPGTRNLDLYQTKLNVFTKNTAIWARVLGLSGQYCGGDTTQPPVMPSV